MKKQILWSTRKTKHFLLKGHIVRTLRLRREKSICGVSLNVGCGPHSREGWINADIISGDIYLDVRKGVPLNNNSVDYIFTEMFSEEISSKEFQFFLEECHRVLVEGGVLRQSIPMLDKLIDIYKGRSMFVQSKEVVNRHYNNYSEELPFYATNCLWFNSMFHRWGHYHFYDEETLKAMYRCAGFSDMSQKEFGESTYPKLNGMERHADVEWMKSAFVNIYEAEK